jgi:hypothetical protein
MINGGTIIGRNDGGEGGAGCTSGTASGHLNDLPHASLHMPTIRQVSRGRGKFRTPPN